MRGRDPQSRAWAATHGARRIDVSNPTTRPDPRWRHVGPREARQTGPGRSGGVLSDGSLSGNLRGGPRARALVPIDLRAGPYSGLDGATLAELADDARRCGDGARLGALDRERTRRVLAGITTLLRSIGADGAELARLVGGVA